MYVNLGNNQFLNYQTDLPVLVDHNTLSLGFIHFVKPANIAQSDLWIKLESSLHSQLPLPQGSVLDRINWETKIHLFSKKDETKLDYVPLNLEFQKMRAENLGIRSQSLVLSDLIEDWNEQSKQSTENRAISTIPHFADCSDSNAHKNAVDATYNSTSPQETSSVVLPVALDILLNASEVEIQAEPLLVVQNLDLMQPTANEKPLLPSVAPLKRESLMLPVEIASPHPGVEVHESAPILARNLLPIPEALIVSKHSANTTSPIAIVEAVGLPQEACETMVVQAGKLIKSVPLLSRDASETASVLRNENNQGQHSALTEYEQDLEKLAMQLACEAILRHTKSKNDELKGHLLSSVQSTKQIENWKNILPIEIFSEELKDDLYVKQGKSNLFKVRPLKVNKEQNLQLGGVSLDDLYVTKLKSKYLQILPIKTEECSEDVVHSDAPEPSFSTKRHIIAKRDGSFKKLETIIEEDIEDLDEHNREQVHSDKVKLEESDIASFIDLEPMSLNELTFGINLESVLDKINQSPKSLHTVLNCPAYINRLTIGELDALNNHLKNYDIELDRSLNQIRETEAVLKSDRQLADLVKEGQNETCEQVRAREFEDYLQHAGLAIYKLKDQLQKTSATIAKTNLEKLVTLKSQIQGFLIAHEFEVCDVEVLGYAVMQDLDEIRYQAESRPFKEEELFARMLDLDTKVGAIEKELQSLISEQSSANFIYCKQHLQMQAEIKNSEQFEQILFIFKLTLYELEDQVHSLVLVFEKVEDENLHLELMNQHGYSDALRKASALERTLKKVASFACEMDGEAFDDQEYSSCQKFLCTLEDQMQKLSFAFEKSAYAIRQAELVPTPLLLTAEKQVFECAPCAPYNINLNSPQMEGECFAIQGTAKETSLHQKLVNKNFVAPTGQFPFADITNIAQQREKSNPTTEKMQDHTFAQAQVRNAPSFFNKDEERLYDSVESLQNKILVSFDTCANEDVGQNSLDDARDLQVKKHDFDEDDSDADRIASITNILLEDLDALSLGYCTEDGLDTSF